MSSMQKTQAAQDATEYQAAVDRNNAAYDQFAATDAINRGQVSAGNARLKYGQVKGTQTASFAARGIDATQGSASRVLSDTAYISNVDAATIQDNAIRAAWGFDVQKSNDMSNAANLQGAANAMSPLKSGVTSLLGSGSTVADSWYRRANGGYNPNDPSNYPG